MVNIPIHDRIGPRSPRFPPRFCFGCDLYCHTELFAVRALHCGRHPGDCRELVVGCSPDSRSTAPRICGRLLTGFTAGCSLTVVRRR
ncbi:DUF3079 domain-containing protein [Natrarchaeobius chitinivorans]|uniref:DUF3079 domain-containing protein n=1 Tax=Natrarchaeobius chitinivorans TaxID=1679083 RepID=A0A3N6M3R0_NATCH|nr:DUF3079 domain-containing protein [Natrarchaeobius chitinivorans]